jgi:DNA-directed RNA polymerase subunit alpha
VTAGDIESTPFVRVVNPDLHLATLTKKTADLDIEITVEKGLGYVPAEARRMERLLVGTVVLDAVFSPVENVAITVQNMRVGERTDYNRLAIEITTDGSISPSEALHKSTSILRDHFEKLGNFEVTPTEVGETKKSAKKAKK